MTARQLLTWLRVRWATRSSAGVALSSTGIPTEQHAIKSAEEAFYKEHGYSMAVAPMEATEDIARHNKALEDEYAAEVEARKVGMRAGLYRPRFCLSLRHNDATGELERWDFEKHANDPEWVNWDLEMSMEPGRRLDVTKDIGIPENAPAPSPEAVADAKEATYLRSVIDRHEHAEQTGETLLENAVFYANRGEERGLRSTVAQLVGTRQQILYACGGNEVEAQKVIDKAFAAFGVTSLDEPITTAPTSPSGLL